MRRHLVLRVQAKLLIPMILLFALYVQFHGDYGPGGGFQAGVIFASGFILYALVFGPDQAERVAPRGVLRIMTAVGLLLYAGTGVLAMLLGANFLDYDALAHDPVHGQHYGIIAIELGVGITVASGLMLAYFQFARRGIE